ncbi:MAG: lipoyl(octanoyl) transferase LipB [Methylococcaceae bacterium]|nr:lipoyl(octanoyl) transferase LipB [Methylococcaceae bacterium]
MQTVLRQLRLVDYESVWREMQAFTLERSKETVDEIWIVEHNPVYTLGLSAKREHLLHTEKKIPVIKTDRGGQVTYHGHGQLVIYPLLDIERLNISVRQIVTILENAMIATLSQYGVKSEAKADAPGVYINNKKIGSVGLRVKRGCCYHGLSFNNNMDLSPFDHINTCGFPSLEVTQLSDLKVNVKTYELAIPIVHSILQAIKK